MSELTKENIKHEFLKIVSKLSAIPLEDLTMEKRFVDDLGFDSLKSMEAISRISDKYDLVPELDEIMELQTIGEVVEYLESKV